MRLNKWVEPWSFVLVCGPDDDLSSETCLLLQDIFDKSVPYIMYRFRISIWFALQYEWCGLNICCGYLVAWHHGMFYSISVYLVTNFATVLIICWRFDLHWTARLCSTMFQLFNWILLKLCRMIKILSNAHIGNVSITVLITVLATLIQKIFWRRSKWYWNKTNPPITLLLIEIIKDFCGNILCSEVMFLWVHTFQFFTSWSGRAGINKKISNEMNGHQI